VYICSLYLYLQIFPPYLFSVHVFEFDGVPMLWIQRVKISFTCKGIEKVSAVFDILPPAFLI